MTQRFTARAIKNQVIVVTGASSGIGLASARMAAEAGAKVFLIARNAEALQAIVHDVEAAGGEAAFARFGRIDTWVNNAGVAIYAALGDTPRDQHERLIRTNPAS